MSFPALPDGNTTEANTAALPVSLGDVSASDLSAPRATRAPRPARPHARASDLSRSGAERENGKRAMTVRRRDGNNNVQDQGEVQGERGPHAVPARRRPTAMVALKTTRTLDRPSPCQRMSRRRTTLKPPGKRLRLPPPPTRTAQRAQGCNWEAECILNNAAGIVAWALHRSTQVRFFQLHIMDGVAAHWHGWDALRRSGRRQGCCRRGGSGVEQRA